MNLIAVCVEMCHVTFECHKCPEFFFLPFVLKKNANVLQVSRPVLTLLWLLTVIVPSSLEAGFIVM